MAMTKREYYAKQEILDRLSEQGYPSYAKILNKFDVNLTADPEVIGYTEPERGRIVLNQGLNIDQVSTITRHEILHNYLKHMQRMADKLGKDVWDNRSPAMHQASNIAGDYEISNRGYTEKDKQIARQILLNGQVLQGLVTEDQHPDWIDLSLEEMYDKILEEQEKQQQQMQNQPGSNKEQGQPSKGTPQIGDAGNAQIQEAEDVERRANAVVDDAGEIIKKVQSSGNSEQQQDAQDIKDQAQDAAKDAEDLVDGLKKAQDGKPESDPKKSADLEKAGVPTERKPFGDPKKIAERLKDLKRILENTSEQAELLNEAHRAKRKEKNEKADEKAKQYQDSPLNRFRESLNAFLKRETDFGRDKTWRRFSKNYSDSDIIRKGTARNVSGHIPVINVYFDRSASWDDQKIKVGEEAVATLNKYVQRGEAKINVYYFSDEIFSDRNSSKAQRSTEAGPEIIEHVSNTRADNVIIMTDADTNDQGDYSKVSPIMISGMVWYLAKGGVPTRLPTYIRGKRGTKLFKI